MSPKADARRTNKEELKILRQGAKPYDKKQPLEFYTKTGCRLEETECK